MAEKIISLAACLLCRRIVYWILNSEERIVVFPKAEKSQGFYNNSCWRVNVFVCRDPSFRYRSFRSRKVFVVFAFCLFICQLDWIYKVKAQSRTENWLILPRTERAPPCPSV